MIANASNTNPYIANIAIADLFTYLSLSTVHAVVYVAVFISPGSRLMALVPVDRITLHTLNSSALATLNVAVSAPPLDQSKL